MAKNIVTVGLEIPGWSSSYLSIGSDQSLLDYDIIVFNPDISDLSYCGGEFYQGKPCLSDSASFTLKEKAARWSQELLTAFENGKTIFVYLREVKEVFVATGTVDHSGSGRNRITTRHVALFSNYKLLPLTFDSITTAHGREIKASRNLGLLSSYWDSLGALSRYEVYFASTLVAPYLVTKTGGKTVGGVVRAKVGSKGGAIIFLPPVYYDDELVEEKNGQSVWTKSGMTLGRKWTGALLEIDEVIRAESARTPPPQWVKSETFTLQAETALRKRVSALTTRIRALEDEKQKIAEELAKEGLLRDLLYETGPALEAAVLDALGILGLKAEGYKKGSSEFDVVFTWKGKRFIGEVEGKDNKAINVDKVSQLERNLSEDFARDDVDAYAHGILFGNAYRLQELDKRNASFTAKCLSTAQRIQASLVRTSDLFFVARHVKETGDKDFATACLEAIDRARGSVVQFPSVPEPRMETVEEK